MKRLTLLSSAGSTHIAPLDLATPSRVLKDQPDKFLCRISLPPASSPDCLEAPITSWLLFAIGALCDYHYSWPFHNQVTSDLS